MTRINSHQQSLDASYEMKKMKMNQSN